MLSGGIAHSHVDFAYEEASIRVMSQLRVEIVQGARQVDFNSNALEVDIAQPHRPICISLLRSGCEQRYNSQGVVCRYRSVPLQQLSFFTQCLILPCKQVSQLSAGLY